MLLRKHLAGIMLAALCAAFTAVPAHAALNAYLKLTGQKQGDIKGSVTQRGRENSIELLSVNHEIVSPRDAQSGLPTGQRMHKPIIVTKEIDATSPKLQQAMVGNEEFARAVIEFAPKGDAHSVERITLQGAHISKITRKPQAGNKKGAEVEEIEFVYQKITWTYEGNTKTYTGEWVK